jgi:hypothetical protein
MALCVVFAALFDSGFSYEMAPARSHSPHEYDPGLWAKLAFSERPVHPGLTSLMGALASGATFHLIYCLGEEIGWRGYLYRQVRTWGFWRASLLTGLVWGPWHFHNALFAESSQTGPGSYLLLITAQTILMSPVMSLLRERARSVWAPAAFHATWNASLPVALGFVGTTPTATTWAVLLSMMALSNVAVFFVRQRWPVPHEPASSGSAADQDGKGIGSRRLAPRWIYVWGAAAVLWSLSVTLENSGPPRVGLIAANSSRPWSVDTWVVRAPEPDRTSPETLALAASMMRELRIINNPLEIRFARWLVSGSTRVRYMRHARLVSRSTESHNDLTVRIRLMEAPDMWAGLTYTLERRWDYVVLSGPAGTQAFWTSTPLEELKRRLHALYGRIGPTPERPRSPVSTEASRHIELFIKAANGTLTSEEEVEFGEIQRRTREDGQE